MTERDLFLSALDIPDPQAREAFLADRCRDNPDLRAKVDGLLAAHAEAGSFLEPHPGAAGVPPASDATLDQQGADAPRSPNTATASPLPVTSDLSAPEDIGTRIGPYRLLQKLGEGGMGTVWVAEQTEPVKRRVALKVIKPGMDSARVVARFEAERQALALMDHTNIAKVFDGGTTPAGRPYFVMELVKGVPVTAYCDELHLSIRDRLGLFVQVCAAVQHAHQKGVIHRDIKPSNVLVAVQDGRPVPKVIDFGVAKAVGARLTDETMYTELGAVIGTPEYMAPEQAELSALDVDTRADVYALGVLLFELLTGTTPLTRSRLKAAGLAAMLRAIKEEEPPKPSTRLTEAKDGLAGLAAVRRTDPRRLAQEVRGELDWIVLRALEKDRTRRYETANGLARDVGRFLADEPVEAGPPSGWYRLRKFVRRNRMMVATAAGFLFLTWAGASGVYFSYQRAVAAEAAARAGQAVALEERDKADAARKEADEQRKIAERQAASAAIDLHAEAASDDTNEGRRAHLLLARLAGRLPPHAAEFREYITARLTFSLPAPLPPSWDGVRDLPQISRDGRYLLAPRGGGGWALLAAGTDRVLADLRDGAGRTIDGGFRPDEGLAWTESADHVIRVWDVPSGRLRLETHRLPTPPGHRGRIVLGPDHLAVSSTDRDPSDADAVLLWDVSGGRFVGRLTPGVNNARSVVFTRRGAEVVTAGRDGTARVWSTADGRLVATLDHAEPVKRLAVSPSGRHLLSLSGPDLSTAVTTARWWAAGTWQPVGPSFKLDGHDDTADFTFLGETEAVVRSHGTFSSVRGASVTVSIAAGGDNFAIDPAARLATDGRRLVQLDTGRVEFPPAGQRYHPRAAALARVGRWLVTPSAIIDLTTQKELLAARPGVISEVSPLAGGYAVEQYNLDFHTKHLVLPPTAEVAAGTLELWAQVVLCGELGAGDEFVPWDEPTWERHRAELAAVPPPLPDFPFPGRVATDRLYWLKRQYKQVENDPAKALPLLDRLIADEPTREWYAARADANVKLGRWAAAADDYLAGRTYPGPAVQEWVGRAGRPPEQYQAAVRLAEYARQAQPEVADVATTLGMASYRVGRDRDAVRVLTEAVHRHQLHHHVERLVGPVLLSPWAGLAADPAPVNHLPYGVAYLVMAHHRLGEAARARAWRDDLGRAVRGLDPSADDPVLTALLKEVEATLAAPPPPPPK